MMKILHALVSTGCRERHNCSLTTKLNHLEGDQRLRNFDLLKKLRGEEMLNRIPFFNGILYMEKSYAITSYHNSQSSWLAARLLCTCCLPRQRSFR